MLLDIINEINRLSNNNTNEIDNTSTIEITLSVNDTFKDQNAINIAVNMYVKQKGFVAVKYHKEFDAIDKTIICYQ